MAHYVAIDLDPRGLGPGDVCGSALNLPFSDGAFDVVTAFDVIEHCEPEASALAEVYRVLRPGGRFLMSVPAYEWAWSDFDVRSGHHRRYTRVRAIQAVETAGFQVKRATYAFAAVFPMFAAERLTRRLRYRRTSSADAQLDLPEVPPALRRILATLCRVDGAVLGKQLNLPFGSSIFLAATKPA
jgi:SAM-dependent methyltransferase